MKTNFVWCLFAIPFYSALSFLVSGGARPALAQVPPSPAAQAYTIHDDLLKCYQSLGKPAETEAEFKWCLTQKPNNAVYHFNYAVFLQRAGKTAQAAAEYKKAAQYDGSNVDFVGSYGQMMLFLKNYQEAYNNLGRAIQMPGGEKYKSAFETAQQYLQRIQQQNQQRQMNKPGAGPAAAPGKKRKDDDDDD